MLERNTCEKWFKFKEFVLELFVPDVVDGDFEEHETTTSSPATAERRGPTATTASFVGWTGPVDGSDVHAQPLL